jgi:hypothetical protein
MVIANVKAEKIYNSGLSNPFYGKGYVVDKYEQTCYREFDKREDIAPCGVFLKFGDKNRDMTIKVWINRYYLDDLDDGCFSAIFSLDGNTYEVTAYFNGNKLSNATVEEWWVNGEFEDGREADFVYSNSESCSDGKFIEFEEYYS